MKAGQTPFGLAYGARSLWVSDRSGEPATRLNPKTGKVQKRIKIGLSSYGLDLRRRQRLGDERERRDAAPDQPEEEQWSRSRSGPAAQPNGVVYAFGAIWVADLAGGKVLKVDVRRNRGRQRASTCRRPTGSRLPPTRSGSRRKANEVVRLDPDTGAVLAWIPVGANPLASAWVGGQLWVPNIDDGTVSVIDPATNSVRTTFAVGKGPLAIAESGGDAWVSNSFDGELWRIHP